MEGKGYRNRLKRLWDDRNPSKCYRSENNLCCQARAVTHSKLLTELELQAIQQSVSHQNPTSDEHHDEAVVTNHSNVSDSPEKTDNVNDSLEKTDYSNVNDSPEKTDPVPDNAAALTASPITDIPTRQYDSLLSCVQYCASVADPELEQMFEKIIVFVEESGSGDISSRNPVPRVTDSKFVKDLTKLANRCINEIMIALKPDLLECNCLVYAAAMAVVQLSGGSSISRQSSWGSWRKRITSQIDKHRKHLSQLVAINSNSTLTPRLQAIKNHLFKLYGINSVHLFLITIETLKQRIKCSAIRLKRYDEKVTRHRQNSLFRSN